MKTNCFNCPYCRYNLGYTCVKDAVRHLPNPANSEHPMLPQLIPTPSWCPLNAAELNKKDESAPMTDIEKRMKQFGEYIEMSKKLPSPFKREHVTGVVTLPDVSDITGQTILMQIAQDCNKSGTISELLDNYDKIVKRVNAKTDKS